MINFISKNHKETIRYMVVIALISILSILTYYFEIIIKSHIVYTHLFYFPIILACYWWKKKGLIVPLFLSGILISFYFLGDGAVTDIIEGFERCIIFTFVGHIISILSQNISKNEQSLRESEKKYKNLSNELELILDNIPALIFYKDAKNNFIRVNKYIADAYNMKKEDFIGKNLFDLYSKEQAQAYLDDDLEIIRSGKPKLNYEEAWETADGLRWALTSKIPLFDVDGEDTGIIGTSIDITERKNAEEKLRESEVKYRHLFETSPYFIGLLNSEGNLIDCNEAINDILSIHAIEDILGKKLKEIFLLNEKSTPLIPIIEKFIKSIFNGVNQEGFDFRLARSIGGYLWIHVEATLIEIEKQKLIQFILQDITERKRSEQLIQETIKELTRSNTELEQFTYFASHDLKEPLRMISSFAQLLDKRYTDKLDEDGNDFIRFITEGAVRMQDLINSLLTYSRIGESYENIEKINLNDILNDIIDNLKLLIQETHTKIIYDSLPSLFADRHDLIQVFQNLISNAIKFRGTAHPLITISARPEREHWLFSIRDNGIGIKPKDFERIFIIFKRSHTTEKHEGTGIGLSICKKIVERHGGKIWVESEVGRGSTFIS